MLAEIALNPTKLVVVGGLLRGRTRVVELQTHEDEARIVSPRILRRFQTGHVGERSCVIAAPEMEQDIFAFEVRELQRLSIESAGFQRRCGLACPKRRD